MRLKNAKEFEHIYYCEHKGPNNKTENLYYGVLSHSLFVFGSFFREEKAPDRQMQVEMWISLRIVLYQFVSLRFNY